ncbi:MAG: YceH family protein, partial [Phycisphaerae bacterium]|nr:YceH family protein [Phycisphaerae bacterium]
MLEPLTELQRRVLGVLIEKALAQPTYYPLTLNALVTGCNQKSNRDPVMELDEATAWDTLEELRKRELASRVLPGAGSRTDRFRHDAGRKLGWSVPQLAIMAELLLRGPQTVGELRTRCARMRKFESVEAVSAELDALAGGDAPVVAMMPRAAGQAAARFRHLLYEPC